MSAPGLARQQEAGWGACAPAFLLVLLLRTALALSLPFWSLSCPPPPRLDSGPSRLSDEDISDWDTSLCSSLLLGHLFRGTLCLPSYFFSGTGPSPPLMPRPRLLSAGPLADIISFAVVLPPRETLLRGSEDRGRTW